MKLYISVFMSILIMNTTGKLFGQAVYTVSSTANSGANTLNEAISNANSNAGVDTIRFNISGTGPHTITLTSLLPVITEKVVIDGESQSGTVIGDLINNTPHQLQIGLYNGGTPNYGLKISDAADGTHVTGIAIGGFSQYGVECNSGADDLIFENMVVGTNITGTTAQANNEGLRFWGNDNCIVRNSLISGNTRDGVVFSLTSSSNQLYRNFCGVNMSGTATISNRDHNIYFQNSSHSNTIGGSDYSYRNVLSGSKWGAHFWAGDNNALTYNYVGTDISGTIALGNSEAGIEVCNGNSGTISNNVFAANENCAICLWGGNLRDWEVTNNIIGTDIGLTESLGNGAAGICLFASVSCTRISGNTITNSYASSSSTNITTTGANGAGIWLREYSSETLITENSIYNNASLGIDINSNGTAELNDDGDGDAGPNNILNFPVLDTVYFSGGNLCIHGWAPSGSTIEFFIADNESSQFGEGKSFLFSAVEGSGDDTDATQSSYGPAAINGVVQGSYTNENRFSFCTAVVSLPVSVGTSDSITATTSQTGGSCTLGFTSEFSAKIGFEVAGPFGLDWVDFTVQSEGADAILEWASSREENTDYFSIERSHEWAFVPSYWPEGSRRKIVNRSRNIPGKIPMCFKCNFPLYTIG